MTIIKVQLGGQTMSQPFRLVILITEKSSNFFKIKTTQQNNDFFFKKSQETKKKNEKGFIHVYYSEKTLQV